MGRGLAFAFAVRGFSFHGGGTLAFQAYSRSGDQLLVATTDGALVSVSAARVRRIQEAGAAGDVAGAALGAKATWQPLGADAATSGTGKADAHLFSEWIRGSGSGCPGRR